MLNKIVAQSTRKRKVITGEDVFLTGLPLIYSRLQAVKIDYLPTTFDPLFGFIRVQSRSELIGNILKLNQYIFDETLKLLFQIAHDPTKVLVKIGTQGKPESAADFFYEVWGPRTLSISIAGNAYSAPGQVNDKQYWPAGEDKPFLKATLYDGETAGSSYAFHNGDPTQLRRGMPFPTKETLTKLWILE